MAQGGLPGNGVKVGYSTVEGGPWTEVEQIVDVVFPTWEAAKVEITTHQVGNKLRRYMPGMIEVGDPSLTVLSDFDPSTSPDQAQLIEWNQEGTSVWWRFEVPTNRAQTSFRGVEFQAGVLNFSPATPIDDRQTTQYTLSFDGETINWDEAVGASQI
jgi:hypothetical protein